MSGREVLTSTMIAARVELIRHLQTVRRRGGRAAAAEIEQKRVADFDCEACFVAALWRFDLQDVHGAESLEEVWGELACHRRAIKGAQRRGEQVGRAARLV